MAPEAAAIAAPRTASGRIGLREAGLVFACTLGNFLCVTPTVTAVFGLFLVPIASEFSWPRARVSAGLSILTLANALVFPFAGRLADRYGTRLVVLAGNLMLGAAILGLSRATPDVALFDTLFCLVGVAGAFSSGMLISKIISVNFTRRRGLWMGFCAGVGNGAGSTFMPVIAGMLMLGSGWRGAYRDIGLIVLGVGFPLLYLLLRDMPHLPASAVAQAAGLARRPGELSLAQALRRAPFWMILSAIAISGGCMIAVFAHVVPLLMDKGFALSQATLVLSVFALTCAVWQSTVGWVLDRTESPRVTAPLYLVAALGLAIMQHASGLPAMIIAGAMLGIALGTEFGMLGYLISRYFGVASFGAISGVMFAVVLLAQAVSPYLMDLTFDRTGSYALALDIVEAAMVAACAVIALLPRYPFALSEN